jgi:hypothetical protein
VEHLFYELGRQELSDLLTDRLPLLVVEAPEALLLGPVYGTVYMAYFS